MSVNPSSLGVSVLPPNPTIVSPDVALQVALTTTVSIQPTPPPQPYGKGYSFDFIQNEFIRHGQSPAEVYDTDNLQVWIEKALRTAKGTYPIYSEDYGVDDPDILIGYVTDPALIGDYESQTETALLQHDRIVAVENFVYQPVDDQLYVQFQVTLDTDPSSTLIVSMPGTTLAGQ
jgi:hypothetical protein